MDECDEFFFQSRKMDSDKSILRSAVSASGRKSQQRFVLRGAALFFGKQIKDSSSVQAQTSAPSRHANAPPVSAGRMSMVRCNKMCLYRSFSHVINRGYRVNHRPLRRSLPWMGRRDRHGAK